MKNKIKLYIPLFMVLLAAVTACDKHLDLSPEDTLVDSEVFANEMATEQALADVYLRFFRAVTGSSSYVFGDFTTANVEHSVFYNIFEDGSLDPADYNVESIWSGYYAAVNVANNLIDKVPKFAKYSESKQAQFIAEAKFVRAWAYFDLLKMFGDGALTGNQSGLGLPLQLTPFQGYDTGEDIPRSTNAEVFDQILLDLTEAYPHLPERYPSDLSTRSRATKGNVQGLLSRIYLYLNRFDEAAAAANWVLQQVPGTYQLAADVWNVFPQNTDGQPKTLVSEYLFAFPVSHSISSSTSLNNNLGNGYFFKRSFWIPQAFVNEHDLSDRRRTRLMFKGDSVYNPDMFGVLTTFKFNNSNGRDNVSMLRLPEVMLNRAEALVRASQTVVPEAIELLNNVRNRAIPGVTPYQQGSFASWNALLQTILDERRKELAFEGHYRFDRMRHGLPPRDNGLVQAKWVLPIPQRDVLVSKGVLEQNSGYKQ